jgi:hypothetical protein
MADNAPAPAANATPATPATEPAPTAAQTGAEAKPATAVAADKPAEGAAKPEPTPEEAATLRQLAAASAENRGLKGEISKLKTKLKELETSTASVSEKATAAEKLSTELETLQKRLREEPHTLLKEFGHTRNRAFWNEILQAYTDDPAENADPRVDELTKTVQELRAEREAEKTEAQKRKEEQEKAEQEALGTREQVAVKTWATQIATKDANRWPILSNEKMADVRDAVAVKVLAEAKKIVAERREENPGYMLPDEEGAGWMTSALDEAEKEMKAEFERIGAVLGAKTAPAEETTTTEKKPESRVLGRERDLTIDSSVRDALPTPVAKPKLAGGPRRLGMPIGR